MRYVPYDELGGRPSIVVDGYPADGTVLTLSHWRGSGTPDELADDLSTQIAFNYLDRGDLHVDAEAVSNNHFDEDGLCGIYALLNPEAAQRQRARIVQVASAGDFDVCADRDAARVAFAIGAYTDEARSPLGDALRGPYPRVSAALHEELLGRLPEMLSSPERYESLWADEDAWLEASEARVGAGDVAIEERPEIDLAIVRVPEDVGDAALEDDETGWTGGLHPISVYNRTRRFRVLFARGRRYALRYRYETWVRYVSEPTLPRVDLAPLAARLNAEEANGRWSFEGVDSLVPSLSLDADESSIPPERFVDEVTASLAGTKR